MKKIHYFKFTYLRYFLFLFLLELVLSISSFFLISNSTILLEKYSSYDDKSLYIFNDCKNTQRYIQEDSIVSYYAYDYKMVDGEYVAILYLNTNAFKTGYLYHDFSVSVLIFPFNEVELKQDVIYNSISEEKANYLNFFDHIISKDLFYTLDISVPYICVSDSYFELNSPTEMVIKNYCNGPSHSFVTNEKYTATAKGLRDDLIVRNSNLIYMILLLSIVPIILSTISVVGFLVLFFNDMKKDIILKRIFYLNQKDVRRSYFIEVTVLTYGATIFSFLISYLFFPIYWQYFLFFLALVLGIEAIFLWVLSSKYVKNKRIYSIDENNFYEV